MFISEDVSQTTIIPDACGNQQLIIFEQMRSIDEKEDTSWVNVIFVVQFPPQCDGIIRLGYAIQGVGWT